MSEIAIMGSIVGVLWGVLLALLGVVWTMSRERLAFTETRVAGLEKQNTEQETALGRLIERMKAREDAHESHRENVDHPLSRIEDKLDKLLSVRSSGAPYPMRYPEPGK